MPAPFALHFNRLLVFQFLCGNGLIGRNGYHLVDIVYGAAARKVVHGAGNALKDRTDCRGMAETLHKFVTDVATSGLGTTSKLALPAIAPPGALDRPLNTSDAGREKEGGNAGGGRSIKKKKQKQI